MYTLLDRRRVISATCVARWEYRSGYLGGVASDWVSETDSLDSFTQLQLKTFHSLWNIYVPSSERSHPAAADEPAKKPPALSKKEALSRFPIGTKIVKPVGDGRGSSLSLSLSLSYLSWHVCSPVRPFRLPLRLALATQPRDRSRSSTRPAGAFLRATKGSSVVRSLFSLPLFLPLVPL